MHVKKRDKITSRCPFIRSPIHPFTHPSYSKALRQFRKSVLSQIREVVWFS